MDEVSFNATTSSSLEVSVNNFVQYFMPIVTGISIPLSLTNLLVFLNNGIQNSPSNIIYINLVIMDLINSLIGVVVSVDMWENSDHKSKHHWGNDTLLERTECYLFLFTFDASIVLVFGLALIRVLWVSMSAIHVLCKLNMAAWIAVGLAYFRGVESCLYSYFGKLLIKKRQPFPDAFIEVSDLLECLMILATISMAVYTQIRIRFHKSKINTSTYRSASWTSFFITLNLTVSYSYYIVINVVRIYFTEQRGADNYEDMCNSPQHWTWVDILLCDVLYVGVAFMCLNSLANSVVLLCQKRTRKFLVRMAKMCWSDVKMKCQNVFRDDYDYNYL
ncbi:uncharacterized protein LOC134814491 [Bolinopsis microptera]|uniref:uncharacterized protein LOC134814491 n=1 Tax=Bolinopsis microptera TaxID=2820187 RepID=UPI0030793AE0